MVCISCANQTRLVADAIVRKKQPTNRKLRRAVLARSEENPEMKTTFPTLASNGASSQKKSELQTVPTRSRLRPRGHTFTIGIEEEFQIVDPCTRELRSHIHQILADGKMILKEHVKAEMHQSMVELGTEVCADIAAARQQVIELRSELAEIAACEGRNIAAAGTHPFSH